MTNAQGHGTGFIILLSCHGWTTTNHSYYDHSVGLGFVWRAFAFGVDGQQWMKWWDALNLERRMGELEYNLSKD